MTLAAACSRPVEDDAVCEVYVQARRSCVATVEHQFWYTGEPEEWRYLMTSFEDYDGDGHLRLRQVLHDDSPEVRAQQFTRDTRGRETELTYTQHLGGYAYPPSIYYRSRQTWGDGDSAYPLEWEQTVAADMGERERPVSRVVVNDLQDGLLTAQHGYELVDDVSGSTVEWTLGVDYEHSESGGLVETRWTESGTPRAWAISSSRYAFNPLGVLTDRQVRLS